MVANSFSLNENPRVAPSVHNTKRGSVIQNTSQGQLGDQSGAQHYVFDELNSVQDEKQCLDLIQCAWAVAAPRYMDMDDAIFSYADQIHNEKIISIHIELDNSMTKSTFRRQAQLVTEANHQASVQTAATSDIKPRNLLYVCRDGAQYDSSGNDFDIIMNIRLLSTVTATYNFNNQLFSARQIDRINRQFCHIIAQLLLLDDNTPLRSLQLLNPSDKAEIESWNRVPIRREDDSFDQIIRRKAIAHPDALALDGWDGAYTYRELDRLSESLAQYMVDVGCDDDAQPIIPICFEKSCLAIIAMAAVHKARAAYVVLDPRHPADRLRAIVSMTNASIILASHSQYDVVKNLAPTVIKVDLNLLAALPEAIEPLTPGSASSPAYIQFTSGSTGEPKGAVITHGNLCSTCAAHAYLGLGPNTRLLQFAAYLFAACAGEIFGTLYFGGCVCVAAGDDLRNNLAGCIRDWRINTKMSSPTVATLLLNPDDVPSLQTMVLGAERLTQAVCTRWASKIRLFVTLGQSEATFTFSGRQIHENDGVHVQDVGSPRNARCWVVDPEDHSRLLPVGYVGEVLVESGGVAAGYFNDPDRTACTFINNPGFLPLDKDPDGTSRRLLKTGDLGRYSDNGTIEYIERKDTQAKWNGIRIDLLEVSYCLSSSLGPTWAVASEMICPDRQPGRHLLAVFLASRVPSPTGLSNKAVLPISEELRERFTVAKTLLESKVPYYMVPQIFVPLSTIPVTLSGKVDRKALKALGAALSLEEIASFGLGISSGKLLAASPNLPPLSVNEHILQMAWSEVLQMPIDIIGAGSFFQLGGDSVAAIRLVASMRSRGFSLTVAQCLSHPKLRSMASVMEPLSAAGQSHRHLDPEPYSLLPGNGPQVSAEVKARVSKQYDLDTKLIEDIYPCTPMQESLMAIGARYSQTYIARTVIALGPEVDIMRLKEAWAVLFQRASILRSTLVNTHQDGTLVAVLALPLTWYAVSDLEDSIADTSFTMSYGDSLCRFAIAESATQRHMVWTWHHAILDGWSVHRLLGWAMDVYEGREPHQILSFCRFPSYLVGCDREAARDFWLAELAGASPAPFPQFYQPLQASQEARTNSVFEINTQFTALPRGDFTVSTMLQAAWALVVSKYSRTNDVILGVVSSGRHAPVSGIDDIIGPTIATIPLRIQLPDGLPVMQLLSQLQTKNATIMKHEHFGLQGISRLGVEFSKICQFKNLLVIQPADIDVNSINGIEMPDALQHMGYDYHLVMECRLSGEGVVFRAHYDAVMLPTDYVQGVVHHLNHVVKQLIGHSSKRIREINMLSPRDEARLIAWREAGRTPRHVYDCVHRIVKKRQQICPQSQAICSWDGDFTYDELEKLSDSFARKLLVLGIKSGVPVPLCFEKSRWAIVAMMGIMKCGSPYIVLDPSHPIQRLQNIVENIGAEIIVASQEHAELVGDLVPTVVEFDSDQLLRARSVDSPWLPHVSPSSPVVLQFTSGSTGKPKGIVIEHAALCSSSTAHAAFYGIGPDTRMFNFAAFVFDVSVADIWTTLMHGGCVCIPKDDDRYNNVGKAITELGANMSFLTPSVATLLDPVDVPGLSKLILGGERVTSELVEKWADALHLVACYGPAETCIYSSATPALSKHSNPTNIGKPFGCRYWVVDTCDADKLAPIGCVGELWIEGPILAREYLNDPERTAAAFVENPSWATLSGQVGRRRFYRTGDLVRYDIDGSIMFVARKDTQVKVRGQRVELAEVDHGFATSQEVKSVAVVLPDQGLFNSKLVAVLVLGRDSDKADQSALQLVSTSNNIGLPETISRLRKHLSVRLAPYMVPSLLAVVNALPHTTSGKIDKKTVKDWVEHLDEDDRQAIVSQSSTKTDPTYLDATERKVQELCSRVLRMPVENISIGQDFISIGGDSISAIRLVMLARSEGLDMKVRDVMTSDTLSKLCCCTTTVVTSQQQDIDADNNSCIKLPKEEFDAISDQVLPRFGIFDKSQIEDIYPCSPIQEGMLITRASNSKALYEAVWAFEAKDISGDPIDADRLQAAWQLVVNRHPLLRTLFFESMSSSRLFDQAVLRHAPQNTIRVTCADCDVKSFVYGPTASTGNEQPSTHRATICMTNTGRTYMKIELLHTCYDGQSTQTLMKELGAAYSGCLADTPGFPYSRYVHHLCGTSTTQDLKFWSEYLQAVKPCTLSFKTEPNPTSNNLCTVPVVVPGVEHLVNRARKQGLTIASMVKAGWSLVLQSYTGLDDVCFGFVASGRDAPIDGVGEAVGPFIRQLICRAKLDGAVTMSQFATSIQAESFECLAHQNAPLMEIQHGLGHASNRLFNTNMSLVHISEDALSASNLIYDNISIADPAECDITLRIEVYEQDVDISLSYWNRHIPGAVISEISRLLAEALNLLANYGEHTLQDALEHLAITKAHPPISMPIDMIFSTSKIAAAEPPISELVTAAPARHPAPPQLWRSLFASALNLDENLIHDEVDFFNCGGDSLAAMRLVLEARAKGLPVRVADVFRGRSPRGLWKCISAELDSRRLNPWWTS